MKVEQMCIIFGHSRRFFICAHVIRTCVPTPHRYYMRFKILHNVTSKTYMRPYIVMENITEYNMCSTYEIVLNKYCLNINYSNNIIFCTINQFPP